MVCQNYHFQGENDNAVNWACGGGWIMFTNRLTRGLQIQDDERCRFFFLSSRPATDLIPWAASNVRGQCNGSLAGMILSFTDFIGLSPQFSISASPYTHDRQRDERGARDVVPTPAVQQSAASVITGAL